MKIKFKSIADHSVDTEKNIIEFEAESEFEIFTDNSNNESIEYLTYQFLEPSKGIANRIEINEKQINIFAGDTTLILKKNEKTANSYISVNNQKFVLISLLHDVEITDNKQTFKYELFAANETLIGKFEISIERI
ncbi:hypothetical protein [Mycoplasmopsis gallinarum]|uniref:hypothetical protein n=1 Tax=Mycoplasmopsis gallinarum TaxID=29557 RepID=UPI000488DBAB|nr:hypothetical protein [Mycoplasmopsis gallinarum]